MNAHLWPITHEHYLPRTFWRRWLSRIWQALAFFALFLLFYMPFVDHYYAQKDPHHSHIYLGAIDHDHDHGPSYQAGDRQGDDSPLFFISGTISLPAAGDWSLHGLRTPVVLLLASLLTLFSAGLGLFEPLQPHTLLPSKQPFLPPPDKPPRR